MADNLSPGLTAKQMLERQLAALGSLYNAGVRSPNFREWRQATLTCIQRIWSADPAKSERFRRIPFSPPMGRPGDRDVREYYERGCGEAASLLKGMIAEIETVGVPNPGAGASGAMAPLPGGPDDDFPTLELPGSSGGSVGSAPTPPSPPKPRLKDLLGFSDLSGPAYSPDAPPVAAGAPPLPQPPAAAPAAAPPAAGAPPLPQPPASPAGDALASSAAQAMAELESQGFFAPPAHVVRDPSAVPPGHMLREPSAAAPTAPPGHMMRELPAAVPASPATPAAPAPPKLVVTGAAPPTGAPPVPAPAAPSAAGPGDVNDLERIADDLLRSSSALSSLPRRQAPDQRATPRDIRSPIPIAIAALAMEVESLGIPDGHRARARAVLLDLSRRLDAPNLTWDALREAMSFIMEFPALGRRIVPLLLPYFDRAA